MARRKRKGWTPPPLEVGDRVKHHVKDAFGVVVKLNGDTATVEIAGKPVVVGVAGLSYYPSMKQIWGVTTKLILRSRKKRSIRRALGLPKFVGVRDECLQKLPATVGVQ